MKSNQPKGDSFPRRWLIRLQRQARLSFYQLQRLPGAPRKIALAVALGVFIGISPTVPFHFILALSLSTLFGLSRLATALGTLVSNPLTLVPTYYACFKIGQMLLFGGDPLAFPDTLNLMELLKLGWKVNLALQVGGVILALPFTVAGYLITYHVIRRYRLSQKRPIVRRGLHFTQNSLPPRGTEP